MKNEIYTNETKDCITSAGCKYLLFGAITISHLHVVVASDGTVYPDHLEGLLAPFMANKMARSLMQAIHEEEILHREPRDLIWNSQDTALSIN